MQNTLSRWRDNVFTPFDSVLFPFAAPEIRVEQAVEGSEYVIRAELPGIDPAKDITVVVTNGMVRIEGERTETLHDRAHSEFHYGRMVRSVALPAAALEETTKARYAAGILEIRVTLGESKEQGRKIAIEVGPEPEGRIAPKPKK